MHLVWRELTAFLLLCLISACAAPAPALAPSATPPPQPAIPTATLHEAQPPPVSALVTPTVVEPTFTPSATPSETPTASPTDTPTATPRPTPTPTKGTPEAVQRNPFFRLIEPLIDQARTERSKAAASDPDYYRRIDARLNEDRINVLAVGYGITYEPPWPPDKMGSITIFSINLRTGRIDQVTINHDVRAPEIERRLQAGNPNEPKKAHKIDKGLFVGGTALLRTIVEDATGLRIDYVITFNDVMIRNLVQLLDGITLTSPFKLRTNPCYVIAGKPIPGVEITGQAQTLTADQTMCFLKGIEIIGQDETYAKSRENANRIAIVKQAIANRLNERILQDPLLTAKLALWLKDAADQKQIETNIDLATLAPSLIANLTTSNIASGFAIPPSGVTVYLVHEYSGDGGFAWTATDSNEITRKDIADGVYTRGNIVDSSFAVAAGGDPYAPNLPEGYWFKARAVVRQRLR
ncbi:MAG: hypothetical protein E6J26_04795 [Chloroflexi bacterium]|nr:MAG: hypothetical protein E6J26_04795 [Chloroflexota bacterium]